MKVADICWSDEFGGLVGKKSRFAAAAAAAATESGGINSVSVRVDRIVNHGEVTVGRHKCYLPPRVRTS